MISGIILIWPGAIASIPIGWHLCDGTAGTPDMRDKYPIAASLDVAEVATAMIAGVQQAEGGSVQHQHNLLFPYEDILDNTPAGDFLHTTEMQYCYPPSTAAPWIMKL